MDTTKPFERALSSFSDEITPHFTLRLKEWPRLPYVHLEFEQLGLDFPELRGYFLVPGTLH